LHTQTVTLHWCWSVFKLNIQQHTVELQECMPLLTAYLAGGQGAMASQWTQIMLTVDNNISYWPYTRRPEASYSILNWSWFITYLSLTRQLIITVWG